MSLISLLGVLDAAQKLASFKQVYKSQPDFIKGGELYSYQLDGLNFLHSAWLNDINVILAGSLYESSFSILPLISSSR